MGVSAVLCRSGSLWSEGRSKLIWNSSLGCIRWTSIGCGCGLVSVRVAVECGSGHTLFELKSWVWVLDCEWLWVRSCDDEAARCGAWVGAHSFYNQVWGMIIGLRLGVGVVLCRRWSLWSVGRGTLFLNSSLGCGCWTAIGCGRRLDCDWDWVRSCVGVARCGVWAGAYSF